MNKELESKFRHRIIALALAKGDCTVRALIDAMVEAGEIRSEKQAHATLRKWRRRGEYDYGVALDLGWLTDKGRWLAFAEGPIVFVDVPQNRSENQ